MSKPINLQNSILNYVPWTLKSFYLWTKILSFPSISDYHFELLQFESHYQRLQISTAMILLIDFILSKYQAERISHLQLSMTLKRKPLMSEPFLSIEYLLDSSICLYNHIYLCVLLDKSCHSCSTCGSVIGRINQCSLLMPHRGHLANWHLGDLPLARENQLVMYVLFS